MFAQEPFNARRIDVPQLEVFSFKSETKMGKAAQVDSDSAIGVALASQRLSVG